MVSLEFGTDYVEIVQWLRSVTRADRVLIQIVRAKTQEELVFAPTIDLFESLKHSTVGVILVFEEINAGTQLDGRLLYRLPVSLCAVAYTFE